MQAIRFGQCIVTQVESSRCLGLEIDCHLKWHKHVTELTKIFSQKLSLLRSLYFLPVKARLDFYFKVILPSVLYGLIIWGSCDKTLFNTLERIHIRAAKLIHGLDWNLPSVDVLARVNWTPIKEFYERGILNFVHKCYYGHAPIPLQGLFTKRIRKYNFRKTQCLTLPKPRTEYVKKSLRYQGALQWNSLDNEARSAESVANFKNIVKSSRVLGK